MADVSRDPAAAGSGRYSAVAIVLHWTIAALIVLQVVLSQRMLGRTPEAFAVFQLHKSVGITVLFLSLARLAWRLLNPPPPLPRTMARWERTLAGLTHALFYVVMIGMPLTGWIMVSTSRIEVPTLLYGTIPWPHLPLDGLAPAARAAWNEAGEFGHAAIITGAFGLVALHVAGALKHQLFSRDEPVLARMAPGAKAGRWLEPRLAVIVLAAVGVVAFGALVQPPRPGTAPPPAVAAPVEEPVAAAAPPPAEAAAPAVAAPAPPGEPVRWAVSRGSALTFTTAWSGQPIRGRFERWSADILFSPEALDRSKVTVSIDVASAATGDAQRDASLPAPDWFDTAVHPKAVFTASRFTKAGEGRFVAHGTLQLRGVSRPLDLPFRLEIAGDTARARGVTSLDRTAFGVGQGEWTSTEQIPAKVSVAIDLKARRR
jgi:cytochrome b561/polyisoprenoid-binding protein YceI